MAFQFASLESRLNDSVFAFQYYQVLRYISSLLVSVILVRSGLPGEQLGKYELWIFIIGALTTFWSSGIRNALMSWYPTRSPEDKKSLISGVFWLLVSASIIAALLLFVFNGKITLVFSSVSLSDYAIMFAIWLVLSVPLVITESILYLERPAGDLVYYAHWSGLSLIIFFVGAAMVSPELDNFILALLLHATIRLAYLIILVGKISTFRFDLTLIRLFVMFSMPVVFNMLLGSAMDMIDGWFVARYYDSHIFPVFRYGARELPFASLLYSSLSAALIPVLIRDGVQSTALRTRATKLMHILFPGTILLIPLSPYLFSMVYNVAFRDSAFIFNIYLLIMTSRVLMPQTVNFALYQHSAIVWTGIIEIFANIFLSYWWMQSFGIYGLAMATVAAYFIQKILLIIYNRTKNGIPIHHYIDMKFYIFYSVAAVIVFLIVHTTMR